VTRDGSFLGQEFTDASGTFIGQLTLALNRGERTRTYAATDTVDPSLTSSVVIRVTAVRVDLRPLDGPPERRLRIEARGFEPGGMLWAHVERLRTGRVTNRRIGVPRGECGTLTVRRRLLRSDAPTGRYRIQFDDYHAYRRGRKFRDVYSLKVTAPRPPREPVDCQGYSPCLPPGSDVDCAGGSGNGPRYVNGPVYVNGSDPYGLDSDGDGVGCED